MYIVIHKRYPGEAIEAGPEMHFKSYEEAIAYLREEMNARDEAEDIEENQSTETKSFNQQNVAYDIQPTTRVGEEGLSDYDRAGNV